MTKLKVLPVFLFASMTMLTLTGCPHHHHDHEPPPPPSHHDDGPPPGDHH